MNFPNGCAREAQNWVNDRIYPKVTNLIHITIANIVASVLAMIIFFKRKDDDVLPTPFIQAQSAKRAHGPALMGTAFTKKK